MRQKEQKIAIQLSQWLQKEHKNLLWRFDIAADLKLTIGQATKNKELNPHKKYPDFFLAETTYIHGGLYLELKTSRDEVFNKKNGEMKKSEHVQGQRIMLEILKCKGYKAEFAFGLEDAKRQISQYIKEKRDERH